MKTNYVSKKESTLRRITPYRMFIIAMYGTAVSLENTTAGTMSSAEKGTYDVFQGNFGSRYPFTYIHRYLRPQLKKASITMMNLATKKPKMTYLDG